MHKIRNRHGLTRAEVLAQNEAALTAEVLRSLVVYRPTDGALVRAVTAHGVKAGDVVGRRHDRGYWRGSIKGIEYSVHRLVWLYHHGRWPEQQLDHINLERGDNRIANLREATNAQNNMNRRKQPGTKSRFKGVTATRGGKWFAQIGSRSSHRYLGAFDTPEEAHAAYSSAAREAFGQFARTE